jgi:hypothetical protein
MMPLRPRIGRADRRQPSRTHRTDETMARSFTEIISDPKSDLWLVHNLMWAEHALKVVADAMTWGAQDKFQDVATSFLYTGLLIRDVYAEEDKLTARGLRGKDYIYGAAAIAQLYGCGNCAEQSAIAFRFLDQHRIKPLDYMQRANGDHAFVVIGRAAGSDEAEYSAAWGPAAVVCDPWKGEAYEASEINERQDRHWLVYDKHWRYHSMLRIP